jgi:UDP-GlcNAc3NAcA epimerase
MRLLSILGAHPESVKDANISDAIKEHGEIEEIIVRTGQYFDAIMSVVSFEQRHIPRQYHTYTLQA